mmetsp:Transcript_30932/g.49630  ORF Transcript_30932/g.49630 Transcript_30932/m.49630 type:complete len:85 (-) Transcript_30932:4694-4948(-)
MFRTTDRDADAGTINGDPSTVLICFFGVTFIGLSVGEVVAKEDAAGVPERLRAKGAVREYALADNKPFSRRIFEMILRYLGIVS